MILTYVILNMFKSYLNNIETQATLRGAKLSYLKNDMIEKIKYLQINAFILLCCEKSQN
jgi:hypothetical protein